MVRWVANLSDLRPEEREQYLRERAEYDAELARKAEQARAEETRSREQAVRLRENLHQAFQAYAEYLEHNPTADESTSRWQAADERALEVLRSRLDEADKAPRCGHIKANGVPCGSPRLKDGGRCFAHQQMADARPEKLELQAVEDPDGIQMAVMQVQRALIDDHISERKAALLLYSLQIAAGNVSKTTFDQWDDEDLVREDGKPRSSQDELQLAAHSIDSEPAGESASTPPREARVGDPGACAPRIVVEDTEEQRERRVEVGRSMRLLIYSGGRSQLGAAGDEMAAKFPGAGPSPLSRASLCSPQRHGGTEH